MFAYVLNSGFSADGNARFWAEHIHFKFLSKAVSERPTSPHFLDSRARQIKMLAHD
jgi:hypothetical protein